MMKDAILQLQMIIPSLKTETSVTATLKKDEDMVMNIDTVIKLPETSYEQKTLLKYGKYYLSFIFFSIEGRVSNNQFIGICVSSFGLSLLKMLTSLRWS